MASLRRSIIGIRGSEALKGMSHSSEAPFLEEVEVDGLELVRLRIGSCTLLDGIVGPKGSSSGMETNGKGALPVGITGPKGSSSGMETNGRGPLLDGITGPKGSSSGREANGRGLLLDGIVVVKALSIGVEVNVFESERCLLLGAVAGVKEQVVCAVANLLGMARALIKCVVSKSGRNDLEPGQQGQVGASWITCTRIATMGRWRQIKLEVGHVWV